MTSTTAVEPDQIWADNDPRSSGRKVRIVSVDATHAVAEVVAHRAVSTGSVGRQTRISLGRFRPTSTGYRLVQHADGTPAEGQTTR
ncbi:DUF6354 family protein [Streptomyces sp. V4-01]|uniref:DUF6354 family protein n=1 Tax=Actinacidiphila polyblastidii TaxID=3110430 RepID=A0ABU7PN55_9ACTN|nr:DUF6354 family protein [Streptomyces sp. V4-01]